MAWKILITCKFLLFFSLLLAQQQCFSQICYGSSGDATSVTSFSNGFPGKTVFGPTGSDLFPGTYTLADSSIINHKAGWRHATNSAATIAVFDVGNSSQLIFTDTIKGLCPLTRYVFSSSMSIMLKNGNMASVTFTARTSQETRGFTAIVLPNSMYSYDPYGVTFDEPASGEDVIITITGRAAQGDDTLLGLLNFMVRDCGPLIQPSVDPLHDLSRMTGCEGDAIRVPLIAKMQDTFPDPFYQWQVMDYTQSQRVWVDIPGGTNLVSSYTIPHAVAGLYRFRMVTGRSIYRYLPTCTVYSPELSLTISKYPVAKAVGQTVCEGEPIMLRGEGGETFSWSGPNGFQSNKQTALIDHASANNAGVYHLIVTNGGTCADTADLVIDVVPKAKISAGADQRICRGSKTAMHATGGIKYFWTPSNGLSDASIADPIANPMRTTTYKVTGVNLSGCSDSAYVTVYIVDPPLADAGHDVYAYENEPVNLNGSISNAESFYWSPSDFISDVHSLHPIVNPPRDMTYTLHAMPESGCTADHIDEVNVIVLKRVKAPTAFTPNHDGVNDTWTISGLETYPGNFVRVYNRYGNLVFEASNYDGSWNGKYHNSDLPAGTYYYIVDLHFGSPITGSVTIIR